MTSKKKRPSGSLVDAFGEAFGKYIKAVTDSRNERVHLELAAAKAAHAKAIEGGESLATLHDWANEIGDRVMQDTWPDERANFWMPPTHKLGKKVSR